MSFIECWKNMWEPALYNYLKQGRKRPEHAHWDWMKKATVAIVNRKDDHFFWIEYDNSMQGIMLVDQSVAHFGQDLGERNIYVHFLEVAPWNFFKDEAVGYYQGVGTILLMTAIQYSDALGFGGRIALESLPQSESFYLAKGMIPVEKGQGQSGLKYFELPTQNAQRVLKGMKE